MACVFDMELWKIYASLKTCGNGSVWIKSTVSRKCEHDAIYKPKMMWKQRVIFWIELFIKQLLEQTTRLCTCVIRHLWYNRLHSMCAKLKLLHLLCKHASVDRSTQNDVKCMIFVRLLCLLYNSESHEVTRFGNKSEVIANTGYFRVCD